MRLMSRLADPVENVESQESDVRVVGPRVEESLLGCTIITPEKRARRLAEWGPMSRFCGS